ncbi:MAG: hypothetical protein EAZ85_09240 [Bacteroidetes bacterium]|nr:MAG: hypothetical protein EAZ85_09240 [Bacteroidota bacterium]TAG88271.1 MAG: hypothetical protein EAZ20_08895 [Bacteroidota bacterium]
MQVIYPPNPLPYQNSTKKIFLAGSIDMGKAEDWQQKIIDALSSKSVIILNPRRTNWDNSWIQSIENQLFKEQVMWELNGLELADLIIYYFAPTSQAPITMLELGLYANSKKIVVCCPDGFWRKGNIDIVCKKYNITIKNNLDELIAYLQNFE